MFSGLHAVRAATNDDVSMDYVYTHAMLKNMGCDGPWPGYEAMYV
jgi:hypothetical protein